MRNFRLRVGNLAPLILLVAGTGSATTYWPPDAAVTTYHLGPLEVHVRQSLWACIDGGRLFELVAANALVHGNFGTPPRVLVCRTIADWRLIGDTTCVGEFLSNPRVSPMNRRNLCEGAGDSTRGRRPRHWLSRRRGGAG